jgi:hypothetical protein
MTLSGGRVKNRNIGQHLGVPSDVSTIEKCAAQGRNMADTHHVVARGQQKKRSLLDKPHHTARRSSSDGVRAGGARG